MKILPVAAGLNKPTMPSGVDQGSFFIVACSLSNHPNDKAEAEPTLAALPPALGSTRSRGAGQRLLERAEQDCLGRASD